MSMESLWITHVGPNSNDQVSKYDQGTKLLGCIRTFLVERGQPPDDRGFALIARRGSERPGDTSAIRALLFEDGMFFTQGLNGEDRKSVSSVVFNWETKMWEGGDKDQSVEPTPGKPWPKRKADVVLLETLMREVGYIS